MGEAATGFTMLELMETKEGKFGDMVRKSVNAVDEKLALEHMKVRCAKCKETTRPAKPKEAVESGKKYIVGYCRACGAKVKALKEDCDGKKESR
jgi:hypothetical protein